MFYSISKLNHKRAGENIIILIIKKNKIFGILFNNLISITFSSKDECYYIAEIFNSLCNKGMLQLLSINNICPINCNCWFKLFEQPFDYYDLEFMGMIDYNKLMIDIYNYESFHLYKRLKNNKL